MTWKSPIKTIDIDSIDDACIDDFKGEDGSTYETVLLKSKGKVIAHCHLSLIERSRVIMCFYEDITYGLKIQKIRRPKILRKKLGGKSKEGDVIKEFRFREMI
jgi:hypothetical protein